MKAFLATGTGATIYTAQVTKGRDFAWQGAVDGLVINDTTYDFEPFGVEEIASPVTGSGVGGDGAAFGPPRLRSSPGPER